MEEFIPNHPTRKKVYNNYLSILEKHVGKGLYSDFNLADTKLQKMALNLERGVFNHCLDNTSLSDKTWNKVFESGYINRAVTIYRNLNPENPLGNVNLLSRLLVGEIDEFELAALGPADIFPERWKELHEKYTEKVEFHEIKLEDQPDGILKCPKCKSMKTEYNEKQTRASDEPSSKFCYCHACGKRWRFC